MDLKGKKIINCAGIALVNNGRVFLIRPLFNGIVQQLGFPKGHVEKNESSTKAAKREFKEETGININDRKTEFIGYVYTRIDDDSVKKVTIYKVDGDGTEKFKESNTAENGEPENIWGCYYTFEKAKDLINPYQKPIIEKLIEKESNDFIKYYNENYD